MQEMALLSASHSLADFCIVPQESEHKKWKERQSPARQPHPISLSLSHSPAPASVASPNNNATPPGLPAAETKNGSSAMQSDRPAESKAGVGGKLAVAGADKSIHSSDAMQLSSNQPQPLSPSERDSNANALALSRDQFGSELDTSADSEVRARQLAEREMQYSVEMELRVARLLNRLNEGVLESKHK